MEPLQAMYGLWDAWLISWVIAALWTARTTARAFAWSQAWRDMVTLAGGIVLFAFSAPEPGRHASGPIPTVHAALLAPLWPTSPPAAWGLVGLTAAGLAVCWWARLHLGRLWSASVVTKAGHRVVDTGPYRLVRHPIYTGILAAALALALAKATLAAFAGFAVAAAGFRLKAKLEEQFLRAELGAGAYDAYSARTPMLLPFPR